MSVYLPDELAREAREAGLNVSALAQQAVRSELNAGAMDRWLQSVAADPPLGEVSHEQVLKALDEVRDEMGTKWDGKIDLPSTPQRSSSR